MFENSQDVLYIVLSISILWFTVFLCWLLYQAARVLRNVNRITENLMEKLEMITEAVNFIKDKVDHLSGKMGVVSTMLTGLVEKFVMNKLSAKLEEKISARKVKKKK